MRRIALLVLLIVIASPLTARADVIRSYTFSGPIINNGAPFWNPIGVDANTGDTVTGLVSIDIDEAPFFHSSDESIFAVQTFNLTVGGHTLVGTNAQILLTAGGGSEPSIWLTADVTYKGVTGHMGDIAVHNVGCPSDICGPNGPPLIDLSTVGGGYFQLRSSDSGEAYNLLEFPFVVNPAPGTSYYANAFVGFQSVPEVPEPSSLLLLGGGLMVAGWIRRQHHRRV